MCDVRVSLRGSAKDQYRWEIGYEGAKPILASHGYITRAAMMADVAAILRCIKDDTFLSYDYTGPEKPPQRQSEVVSVTKLVLRKGPGWQVTSRHGWGILFYGTDCGCRVGDVIALFAKQVHVGQLVFDIVRLDPSPAHCDVYTVNHPTHQRKEV